MAKKNTSKQDAALRVVGLGGAFVDIVCLVSEEFVAGLKDGGKGTTVHCTWEGHQELLARLPQDKIIRRCGGGVGTTLRRLSRKHVPTAMVSAIGDDAEGRFFLEKMQEDGVDTSRVNVVPGEHTGLCISLVTPDGERTMRTFRGINDRLGKYTVLRKSDLEHAALLYSEGYLCSEEDFVQKSLSLAYDSGVDVLFDVGSSNVVLAHQNFLKNTIRQYVTAFFANQDEAMAFTGNPDPFQAALLMNQFYTLSFVKCGGDGSIFVDGNGVPQMVPALEGEEKERVGAKLARCLDTTGAGDAWAAGFIGCYLNDLPAWDTVRIANIEAVCQLMENQAGLLA